MRSIAKVLGIAALGVGGCILAIGLFILILFVFKYLWSWVIPDLFPGAVKQGLIAKSISYYTAFKLAVFVAVLGGAAHILMRDESHSAD